MDPVFSAELDALVSRYAVPAEGRRALVTLMDDLLARSRESASPSTFGSWSQASPEANPGHTWDASPRSASPTPPASPVLERMGRYEVLGKLGEGGMGVVYRVRDPSLRRTMALKVIQPELLRRPSAVARFVEEAQITAQLQHPGVVPVHEIGHLPDGRLYFTMMEVAGRTLRSVIRELHLLGPAGEGGAEWTLRRLVEAYRKVCEAVAYAHARGVLHRDLKPSNVMLGDFGEVLVLDWGLAGLREADGAEPLVVERGGRHATLDGSAPGTPWYMSPEQALGQHSRVGPRSDVYALGAMLFEILVGRPPHAELRAEDALRRASEGAGLSPSEAATALEIPRELDQICARATAPAPEQRYPDALALARAVGAWLEGARRQEQALEMVSEADSLLPEIAELRARASARRQDAERQKSQVRPQDPVERKRPVWALEDEADRLEQEAELRQLDWNQRLHAALNLAPDLDAAHERLARHYQMELIEAEARRDRSRSMQAARLFAAHDRGRHAAWLRGEAYLTLRTDPEGASATLYRYEATDRRLFPVFQRELGVTPLITIPLSIGSYLVVLRAPGRAEVRYPVWLGRGDHWFAARDGAEEDEPVPLPEALGPDEVYVPAGWMRSGAPVPALGEEPPERRWVDGLILRRFPVTNTEYLEYLNALVDDGREAEAFEHVPRERTASDERGAPIYGRDGEGRYGLRADFQGDMWDPRWPVISINWADAQAYAAWRSGRDGLPWRLPTRAEWQKAARGVDGRVFPWGDSFDPTFCCMRESFGGRGVLTPVGSFEADLSPYGARDMAGNARTWCADGPVEQGEAPRERFLCGGNWNGVPNTSRTYNRSAGGVELLSQTTGIRLVRSWPG